VRGSGLASVEALREHQRPGIGSKLVEADPQLLSWISQDPTDLPPFRGITMDRGEFDCFLSHNSRDKPAARALTARLRERGISVWLDEEQLRP